MKCFLEVNGYINMYNIIMRILKAVCVIFEGIRRIFDGI